MRSSVQRAVSGFWDHGCVTHGAALAFYALFVLVPVPIVVMWVVAAIFGEQLAAGEVVEVLRTFTGEQVARTLGAALATAGDPAGGTGSTLFVVASLTFGATAFFVELQETLNKVWEVPSAGFEWRSFLASRGFSFVMVGVSGAVLLVLTVAGVAVRTLGHHWIDGAIAAGPLLAGGRLVLTVAVLTALFGLVFRFVPEATVSLSDLWLGALVTAMLFVVGSELIGLYLRYAALATVYGAVGSLVLTVTWVYYSSLAFLFGAELTRALGERRSRPFDRSLRKGTTGHAPSSSHRLHLSKDRAHHE